MRFNPPPTWPLPPGWQPNADWAPDPSWPPAPPGWQFWIEDTESRYSAAAFASSEGEDPRASRVPWVVAGISSTAVVALVVALVVVLHQGGSDGDTNPKQAAGAPQGLGLTSIINLGQKPNFIGIDADMLYLATDSGLVIVDPKDTASKRSFSVPTNFGSSVAFDAQAHSAWVSSNDRYNHPQNRQLSIVDIESGIVDTETLPYSVLSVAIDPDLRRVYAINRPDNQENTPDTGHGWVTVFDADTHREITTVELSFPAYYMAIDPKSHTALVAGWMGVTLLSTDTLTEHDPGIDVRSSSVAAAVDPNTHTGYVASSKTLFTIDVVDGNVRSEERFPADPGPGQFAVDPSGGLIAMDSGELLVIDPVSCQILASTKLGDDWVQMAVDGSTGTIYATDYAQDSVRVVARS